MSKAILYFAAEGKAQQMFCYVFKGGSEAPVLLAQASALFKVTSTRSSLHTGQEAAAQPPVVYPQGGSDRQGVELRIAVVGPGRMVIRLFNQSGILCYTVDGITFSSLIIPVFLWS